MAEGSTVSVTDDGITGSGGRSTRISTVVEGLGTCCRRVETVVSEGPPAWISTTAGVSMGLAGAADAQLTRERMAD